MIVQGSNNPLVLTFDTSVDDIPSGVAILKEKRKERKKKVKTA